MKKKPGYIVLLLLFLAIVSWLYTSGPISLPFPMPTEWGENEEEEEANRERRKAWVENMHRSAPGTNWRQVDIQTRQLRARQVMNTRMELLKNGRYSRTAAEEILANGQLTGTWQELGSDNQAGRVHIADVDLSTNTIYCASAGGNIWKGKLDGSGWRSLNDYMQMYSISSVKILTTGAGKRLVAVDKNKVYYSDNEGVTWNQSNGLLPIQTNGTIARAVYANDATQSIYLLAAELNSSTNWSSVVSVYISTDKGQTFTRKKTFAEETYGDISFFDLWTSPTGSGRVFLINKSTVYTINTQGNTTLHATFTTNAAEERPYLTGFDDKKSLYLYVYMNKQLYRSKNGGKEWTFQADVEEQPFSRNSFYCSAKNPQLVYLGGVDAYKSYDGGESWSKVNHWYDYYSSIANKLHADIPGIQSFISNNGQEFYLISTDGGLYVSTDSLQTVKNISLNGLNIGQYYSSYTFRDNPQIMYLGSQDQGYQKTRVVNGKLQFKQEISGDYGQVVSSDGGKSVWLAYPSFILYDKAAPSAFTYSTWNLTGENFFWLPPLMAHPTQSNKVYLAGGGTNGGSHIFELTEEGGSITHTEHPFNFDTQLAGKISAMAYSPVNSAFRYVLTERGIFYRSTDGGKSWTRTPGFNGPQGHYFYGSTIVASAQNLGTVYIAGSGYSNSPAYVSTDHGNTFKAINAGLPTTMVYQLAATPDEKFLFAATEVGPYVYVKAENKWYDLSGISAPDQTYWSVDYIPSAQIARFATYGRGIWDFKISTACAIPGELAFTGSPTFCQGDSLVLQAPAGNNFTYQWQKNGTDLVNATKQTFAAKETGTYQVKVKSATCTKISNSVAVTVKALPPQPGLISGQQITCTGNQPYSIAGVAGVTYTWQVSGGGTLTGSANTVTLNWTTPGTHTLTVTPMLNGCAGSPRTLAVVVQALPNQPSLISGLAETCVETQVYSVSPTPGVNYSWSVSGGGSINGSGNKIALTWTKPGRYVLTVTPSIGSCTGPARTMEITVNDKPAKPVIILTNSKLSSSSSTGNQWFREGLALEGATSQVYEATVAGNYAVQVSNECGQSEMSEVYQYQIPPTAVPEELEKLVKVYPNPAREFVVVELPDELPSQFIYLYDAAGIEKMAHPSHQSQTIRLNLQEFSKGTYTLRIQTSKGTVVRKVVVQ
ncbi:T9SS type A sorting domain-containing protein [Rhodocytophaga aerolata]|uniref:T9SS type A sorting domain-containing protein n=1 Tax=Rhodocytophaga aerolata TaxID=455078 RepID=A0ABT8R344_9BACT|nr:PKD domain-containing protein [Rhodocytophaga aerolata]MDO1445182.1 T9SS type A sorting domain-containing protein [Rhodocytophaga aerolata]